MNWLDPLEDLSSLTDGLEPLDPARLGDLLVVLPHPDDESFAAGGTIALFSDSGRQVHYLCGTYGDGGRRMGSPPIANRESMRDIREQELAEACRVLGCSYELLGLRDKTVEFEDPERVAGLVRDVIRERRPGVVITFYPGHAVHPDHDALGAAVELAVSAIPPAERPLLLAVAVGNEDTLGQLGSPERYSDIRSVAERKAGALKAHRSQTQSMFEQLEDPAAPLDERTREFRRNSFSIERFYVLPRTAPVQQG